MKCPKCGYLGFERVERCRNCGYEFSLASDAGLADLTLRDQPADDGPPLAENVAFLRESDARRAGSTPDLPLFGASEDEPLITKPSPPRPPLAVRRATPEVARVRTEARPQFFDLGTETESGDPAQSAPRGLPDGEASETSGSRAAASGEDASLAARFLAVTLDVLLLSAIDLFVVYLTLQFCGVTVQEIGLLPKAPLLGFLFVQNCGYLVAFTVGGQTLGKMALGIKVVAEDAAEPLDLGRSVRRTLLWWILAIPAGLGFLTALFTRDHRGLHDRLAGTRVVRASA